MEGKVAGYSLLRILFCTITIPVLLSQQISLLPGPEVYVINDSNLTLWCTTDISWTKITFRDFGIASHGPEVVVFKASSEGCTTTSVLQGYSGQPCYLGQPVGFNIHKVPKSYHNKSITCQVNLGTTTPVKTVVKIREMLTTPRIEPKNGLTLREGLTFEFICTAQSIPTALIEWFLGGSKVSSNVTNSSPSENTNVSTIKFQARKENNGVDLYCRANNSFNGFPSSSVRLNVLYVPSVYIEPRYNTYVVYEGQKDISMTCKVADANPSNIIQYQWANRGGIVNNEKVNIAVISRGHGGTYSCNASNTAGTSKYATCLVDVQYGPIIDVVPEKNITAGTDLSVFASVDANPSLSAVWWTRLNDSKFMYDGLTLKIPKIQKQYSDNYTCHARNTLLPSGMPIQNKTSEKMVYVNVQYVPSIKMTPEYNPYILYSGQTRVALTCIVEDANPLTSITYHWTNPAGNAEGRTYNISTVSNKTSGYYRCLAKNSIGNSSIYTKQIVVHYGPIISVIPRKNITAGNQLSVSPVIDANPKSFVVWWTRHNDDEFIRYGPTLMIPNIQKQDSNNYICHVRNTLVPSGLPNQNKTSETVFYVNVQYVPTVNMKPVYDPYVIYSGQNNVSLTCIVEDANPLNGITYYWTYPAGNAVGQKYPINTVSKTTSGQYNCSARNSIGKSSVYTKQIHVHYGPLISNISNQEDIVEGNNLMIYPVVDSNPAARFEWWTRRNNTQFRFNSAVLIINKIHRNASDNYTFHVINTLTPSEMDEWNSTSERILYVNVQYPPSSIIADAPNRQFLENTTVTFHCTANDANPSTTSISWYKNESVILSNTANYTITNIKRKAAGSYICNAGNKVGNGTSFVNVTVLYGPEIKNLVVLNGSTVQNNSTAVLECEIDSNPASRISWTFNNKLMPEYDYNEKQRFYNIRETTCYHTGSYRCAATNTIYKQIYNASKEVNLYVTCSPRLNIYMEQPEVKVGLPLGGILNLSVHIIAYPELTKKEWTFRPNSSSNISHNQEGTFISKVFRHIASLYKTNMTENDFGDYTLEVNNSVGSNTYNFHVVPEGPPEPSFIINATCSVRTALVYWVTAFSGGDTQQFSVIIDNGNRKDTIETNLFSNAKDEIKNTSLHLSPGEYAFTILGENQYASTMSLNMESCHVKDASNTETNYVVAAAAGGGIGTAVIILGAIVCVLFILKRRRMLKGKEQTNGRKILTDEDNDDDGLKDNPLYGTASTCNDTSGPMYSQVKKSYEIEEDHEDAVDIGAVYSQVQKKTSKGKIVKDGKGKKKEKQFERNRKDIEMGSVYENSDKVTKEKQNDEIYANTGTDTQAERPSDKCGYQQNKNKDGLIYADLDLAPSGKRFVIRGIENRNNYAIIDLTKTAEPLPSDEEDDKEPNGPGNTTTNLE